MLLASIMGVPGADVTGATPTGVWGAASPPCTGAKPGVIGAISGVAGMAAALTPGAGVLGAASPPTIGINAGVDGFSSPIGVRRTLLVLVGIPVSDETAAVCGGRDMVGLDEVSGGAAEAGWDRFDVLCGAATAVAGGGVGVLGAGRPGLFGVCGGGPRGVHG